MTEGKRGHGGARKGAGRPRKFDFFYLVTIGQACENLWRIAVADAKQKAVHKYISDDTELEAVWSKAQQINIENRKQWLQSEDYEQHKSDVDVEVELSRSEESPQKNSRFVSLTAKPPRGTRKRIIEEVSSKHGLTFNQVRNLWVAYRHWERQGS